MRVEQETVRTHECTHFSSYDLLINYKCECAARWAELTVFEKLGLSYVLVNSQGRINNMNRGVALNCNIVIVIVM